MDSREPATRLYSSLIQIDADNTTENKALMKRRLA
jgi:hypothetical protein